jgi:hypothetical protein
VFTPGRECCDGHGFDHGEWVPLHHHPVFERSGLGFICIAHQVVREHRLASYCSPFSTGRKCGTTTTNQSSGGDFFDDCARADCHSFGEGHVSAVRPVSIERKWIVGSDALQEHQCIRPGLRNRSSDR